MTYYIRIDASQPININILCVSLFDCIIIYLRVPCSKVNSGKRVMLVMSEASLEILYQQK